MIGPARKPFTGLRFSAGSDELTEAALTTKTLIAPTMQETTAGTIHTFRRFRPNRVAASSAASMPFVNLFTKTSSTGGTWTPGKTYFAGTLLTVTSEPSTITVDATHYCFWITVDFSAVSATWGSGTAFPAMTDSTEVYRMLDVTFTSGAIVSFVCPTPHDIHVTAKSS
jgi:hypothetical protein